jgi:ABC-2 type transport system ATP-binding protein
MSEVRDIVRALKDKKRLIFMSSHILSEVSDVCDEVAMVDHGKLLVYDTLSNVTSKFSGGGNVVEVSFIKPLDASTMTPISSVTGITTVERIDDKNLRVKFSGGMETQQSILNDLVGMKIGVVSFKPAASALEDVYLSLIADSR